MKTTEIETKCEIYDTVLTIRDYGHKICVTEPYVQWDRNTGTLAFRKWTTHKPQRMAFVRKFADAEALGLYDGSYWDMLDYIFPE